MQKGCSNLKEVDDIQGYIKNIASKQSKSLDEVSFLVSKLRQHHTMNYIKIMYSWYGYGMLERLYKEICESEVEQ